MSSTKFQELIPSTKKRTHILAIRLSAMGDVAMAVPVIRTLVATYPQLKITFLTRRFFVPMFNDIPNTQVYEADVNGVHQGVLGLGRLAKELRNEGVEKVADLHNVLRTNVLKSVFYFYGIPFQQIDKGRAEKKKLIQESIKNAVPLKSSVQRYADVFANLGFPIDLNDHVFPEKRALPNAIRRKIDTSKKIIGIAPFAQHQSKVYPVELMENVLIELNNTQEYQIFLFGGGAVEKEQLQKWENQFECAICVAGLLNFEEELALLSNLDIMLSMDSGNGHMAAMYGVPVVTIWGVTHPFAGFVPFNQPLSNSILPNLEKYPKIPTSIYGNKYPDGYEKAIASINPSEILKKIQTILLENR
ncbi:glycosyltransferase family 9 protein [Zunongwangia sp.]|uniref:glycosyltransferase family 9 protein n=1 Tax=Zunongwangia sp. TaxID=1965325 RepID=UPI003AA98036